MIANLAKGTIGELAANLLGSLLVSHMQLIAMERGAVLPDKRIPFYVHVDEFQTLSSDAFASLLSEARKFALHFVLGNQYTDQLSDTVRSAVIGNAGTLLVFRVGSRDAELLAPEFRTMEPGTLWIKSRSRHGFAAAATGISESSPSQSCTRISARAVP